MRGILWSDLVKRIGLGVVAVAVALVAIEASVVASPPPPVAAPEIDGASMSAGLSLLGAGVLWLKARRSSK